MTEPEEAGRGLEDGFGARYARGLRASARNNASAYGYSVTISASGVILSSLWGTPNVVAVFAFAGGAIAAFAFVEAIVTHGFRHKVEDEPSQVKALGSSISIFSVGLALVVALVVGRLLPGHFAWPLGSFLATVAYLLVFGLELRMAEWLEAKRPKGGTGEAGGT